jgi:hypothetical protein
MIKRIDDNPYALIVDGRFKDVFSGDNAWDRAKRASELFFGHVMIVKVMYGTDGSVYQEPIKSKNANSIADRWAEYFNDYNQPTVAIDPIRENPVTPTDAFIRPLAQGQSISDRIDRVVRERGLNNTGVNLHGNDYGGRRGSIRAMDMYRSAGMIPYPGEGSGQQLVPQGEGLIGMIENSYRRVFNEQTDLVGIATQAPVQSNVMTTNGSPTQMPQSIPRPILDDEDMPW